MGHTGTADGLDQSLFDDAVLDIQAQLACALLRCAPAHAMGKAGDILDFLCLHPFALFGNGSRAMIRALGNRAHMLDFCSIDHIQVFLSRILKAGIGCYYDWIIPRFAWEVKNLRKIRRRSAPFTLPKVFLCWLSVSTDIKIEKTVKAFSIFELRFLFRTENAVAGVAEAGDDVAMLV